MSPIGVDANNEGWRKASRSVNNGACVEVASASAVIMVRDSVDPSGPVVGYSTTGWQAFLVTAKTGGLDSHR